MEKYEKLLSHDAVKVKDIPNIDLYMDQVTGYMDTALEKLKIDEEDKVLTKTMINNYVKAKVIDKPIKKKYSKNHLMELIMIYHLKNIVSISDVDNLFKIEKELLSESKENKFDETIVNHTEDVYKIFLDVQEEVIEEAKENFKKFIETDININKDNNVRHIIKLVLEADINKRLAELMLKELKVDE
ncbi:DUF1836 domain-containing protein [Clostridium sediminicola]|uniref:DUF1836 domain-containing protein n=1 Tax=Clostridium sediminicola TaxID=3114879 RepID=UPI0031F20206